MICEIAPVEIIKASGERKALYTAAKLLCLTVFEVSFLVSAMNELHQSFTGLLENANLPVPKLCFKSPVLVNSWNY